MKETNEFDDLARQKLEEREFPFQEAHWLEMEKALHARKRSKRRFGWWLAPILLVAIGGGIWLQQTPDTTSENVVVERIETREQAVPTSTEKLPGTPLSEDPIDPVATGEADPVGTPSTEERSAPEQVPGDHDQASVAGTGRSSRNEPPVFPTENDRVFTDQASAVPSDHATSPSRAEGSNRINVGHEVERDEPAGTEGNETILGQTPVVPEPTLTLPITQQIPTTTDGEPVDHGMYPADAPGSDAPTITFEDAVADQQTASPQRSADLGVIIPDQEQQERVLDEISVIEPVPMELDRMPLAHEGSELSVEQDTIAIPEAAIAGDTLMTPELPIEPLSVVGPRSPLEIGVHLGATLTNSTYGGPVAQEWNSTTKAQLTYSGGAEVMRMGRNFGIGSGVHYSTYAERLRTDEINVTETTHRQYYFLTPVDTTLLIITDTIMVDGQVQYVGQSIYTTVNVLDQGVETTTTTNRLRDARDQLNRTSYLEIPLLLDAHVVQGRWSLGLRGGPTVGILSQRRGALPNNTFDGYIDLADQQFRSVVFGYTARAYIRHRFNAGWSIGMEPMIRGHLASSLEGDAISRHPYGVGGVLTLNYRFR